MVRTRVRGILAAGFSGALAIYAAWPWLPLGRAAPPQTIVFYGFSILGEAMNEGIFPAFQQKWQAQTGRRVEFVSAFAGSGTVTNQILLGVPADLAVLALELDAERLADSGRIAPGSWRSLPERGVVNRTPFVILVRPGNPRAIRGFSDLARPGVRVIHPDPLTSGGANWAILAEYGSAYRESGGSAEAGAELLRGLWRNVATQAPSARAARTQFETGFGDALVTYEQEALLDLSRGRLHAEVVYPRRSVLSEHTLVVLRRPASPDRRAALDAFVRFLWSEEAQRIFVRYGFRSVDERWNAENPSFGRIDDLFRVDDFGGWRRARAEIIDGIWKNRILQEVSR